MTILNFTQFIFLLLVLLAKKGNGYNETCFPTNTTYAICILNDTTPTIISDPFSGTFFHEVCHEHFVDDVLGNPCEEEGEENGNTTPTTAERYGYGFLAVFIVSALSLAGLLTFPFIYKMAFQYVLAFFTALAVGTLLGDAIFHLIPFTLGLHSHRNEDGQKEWKHSSFSIPIYQWRLLVAVMILYGFYLLEVFLHWIGHGPGNKNGIDSQVHVQENVIRLEDIPRLDQMSNSSSMYADDNSDHDQRHGKQVHYEIDSTLAYVGENYIQHNRRSLTSITKNIDNLNGTTERTEVILVTGWMVLIGDGIHNFADGLAIGAAFSQNLMLGLTTTIAIGCHELPHEFGDYAILIQSGFTHCRALAWNFISATTAIIGFFVGTAISTDENVRQWIFAVTIGMFLYIALVDLLPTLLLTEGIQISRFIYVNIGFLIGVLIMFILAIFEEELIKAGQ